MSERASYTSRDAAAGSAAARKSRAVPDKPKHAHREASSLETKGVTPTQQARSKATFRSLILAGMRIVEAKEFQAITIAEIARAADVSVGAFYDRFQNKDVFLMALQEIVAEDIETSVHAVTKGARFAAASEVDAVAILIKAWLKPIREHRGLIKATLGYVSAQPGAWSPLRRAGRRVADIFVGVLEPRLLALGRRAPEREIRYAMQFVFGTVVHSIMIDPGPMTIDQDVMRASLVKHLARFLDLDAGKPARGKGRA
jgi:AcrR family transcriptional regulator